MVTKRNSKTQNAIAAKNNDEAAPKKKIKEEAQEVLYITRV